MDKAPASFRDKSICGAEDDVMSLALTADTHPWPNEHADARSGQVLLSLLPSALSRAFTLHGLHNSWASCTMGLSYH